MPYALQDNVLTDLSAYALLRIGGEDAESFLQGQLTCDLQELSADRSSYGAYCTPKGRMLASFLIWRAQEGYGLLIAQDIAAAFQRRLQMFVLRSKVKIENAQHIALGLAGSQAAAALIAAGYTPPAEAQRVAIHGALTLLRLGDDRFLAIAEDQGLASTLRTALQGALNPVDGAFWQWLEIVHGIPWITAPTQEQFVPQMTNLEKIGGVSFKKGCYTGQEIVARTQYLGKANRRMYRAHCAEALQAGDEIFADAMGDQACGMVVNAAPAPEGGWEALAVVHHNAFAGAVHVSSLQGPPLAFGALPYAVE